MRASPDTSLDFVFFYENISLGEFDVLWANAIDILRYRNSGFDLPSQLYFSEIYSLIPSFFLPFEKINYSEWFLKEIHPEIDGTGAGLMFGLLSQLAGGYGYFEAILRGFLLGIFLKYLSNMLFNISSWWVFPLKIYISIWIFYVVRDSSFAIINFIFQTEKK